MTPPDPNTEREQIQQAIAAQESLRGMVDDAIIEASIIALKQNLAALDAFGRCVEETADADVSEREGNGPRDREHSSAEATLPRSRPSRCHVAPLRLQPV